MELFAGAFEKYEVHSEGLLAFRERIREIVKGEEFQGLKQELGKTETDFGNLKSVTIGVNLDENLCPKEAGILSVNVDAFKPGSLMDKLFRKKASDQAMISSLYPPDEGASRGRVKESQLRGQQRAAYHI